jgi:hypothetical protein
VNQEVNWTRKELSLTVSSRMSREAHGPLCGRLLPWDVKKLHTLLKWLKETENQSACLAKWSPEIVTIAPVFWVDLDHILCFRIINSTHLGHPGVTRWQRHDRMYFPSSENIKPTERLLCLSSAPTATRSGRCFAPPTSLFLPSLFCYAKIHLC